MPIKVQGGKEYKQVAERLILFWDKYPECRISTGIHHFDGSSVVMRAEVLDADGIVLSRGHAHAVFGQDTFTDKVMEKCETCAVGRALAFLEKDLMGGEIASAEELDAAIKGVPQKTVDERNFKFMQAFFKWQEQIDNIKDRLADNDFDHAKELMSEIPNEDKLALNRSWTKGGPFTTTETKQIKWWSNEWQETRRAG